MQKIVSYLYPNRITVLADLAGFNVEYTNVYQRIVKIYKGVDNILEFEVLNADQKRMELNTTPVITDLMLNVMDQSGNALPNSPYTVTPSSTIKGIASAVIPTNDLEGIQHQFLTYSLTATKDTNTVPIYGDTRFGALGTIEIVGSAMPIVREARKYKSFTSEIDLKGVPTWHSSAIPCTYYEAVKTNEISFDVSLKGLTGSVWIEATRATTISVESFKQADILDSSTVDNFTGTWSPDPFTIGDYKYFRVSYQTPTSNGVGASFTVTKNNGVYTVAVKFGGTGYAVGSQLKVLGSVLGGVDEINDLIITVTAVEGNGSQNTSSYAMSAVMDVSHIGTASAGTATYIVTGTNISGTVDSVTVN